MFYNFFDLQYTYDELSALNRLEYNSFNELIQKGVMPDAHPALIQVFLYYYALLFGTIEWLIKLPFILLPVFQLFWEESKSEAPIHGSDYSLSRSVK